MGPKSENQENNKNVKKEKRKIGKIRWGSVILVCLFQMLVIAVGYV